MLFASQGRFLSRNLQQVAKNIIARAIDAVSATGIDPYRLVIFKFILCFSKIYGS